MASIMMRTGKDGKPSFRIHVSLGRDSEGRQIIKTTTFTPSTRALTKAQKEAEEFAAKFEKEIKEGTLPSGDKMTFSEFVEIWQKYWLPTKTKTVQENYMIVLRHRVLPNLGNLRITTIRATHIDRIIKDEITAGKAPATVQMTFTVVNSVMKYALKKQYIRENPCTRCDERPSIKPKSDNDLSFFNQAQTKIFLEKALTMEYTYNVKGSHRVITMNKKGKTVRETTRCRKGDKLKRAGDPIYTEIDVKKYQRKHTIPYQWQVYYTLDVYSGFRRGEMCALTWEDIDFKNKTISINKALAGIKGNQFVKDPKTEAGNREIMLPDVCFTMLAKLHDEDYERMTKMGTAWKGHRTQIISDKNGKTKKDSFEANTIFTNAEGGPVHLSTPGHKFEEIIEMYNATCENEEDRPPCIRLHDLRHTSATLLLTKNCDIETVSHRLGHSKASVTLDIYGHATKEADREAPKTLEALLG